MSNAENNVKPAVPMADAASGETRQENTGNELLPGELENITGGAANPITDAINWITGKDQGL